MAAQIPNTTAAELGAWLVALAACVVGAYYALATVNQWREFMRPPAPPPPAPPPPRPSDLYVTRGELEATEQAILKRLDKHEDYAHKRLHDLADAVQKINLKVAEQPNEMRKMIDSALTPLANKIDALALAVSALGHAEAK